MYLSGSADQPVRKDHGNAFDWIAVATVGPGGLQQHAAAVWSL